MNINIPRFEDRLKAKRAVLRYFETVEHSDYRRRVEAEVVRWTEELAKVQHDVERAPERCAELRAEIASLEATLNPHALEKMRELVRLSERIERLHSDLTSDDISRIRAWLDENESRNSSSDSPA